MTQKKSPPKREVKKQAKVVEHTLTANKKQTKTAELKPMISFSWFFSPIFGMIND